MSNHTEKELETKYLRAVRLKNLKELEKDYSKEIIDLYKSKLDSKKKEEEFRSVVELYKTKLEEINFLKQKKEEIFKNISLTQTLTQKQNQMMEEYFKELERKKIEFDKFMSERGKDALKFIKKNNELKNQLKEELFKLEKKREVKQIEKQNANKIVAAFKEKETKRENIESEIPVKENILYKINQTFHNMGNKIDFSTTRFHNVIVIKHEDQLQEMNQFLTANEKANFEGEKLKERRKSKEISKKKFETETKLNGKEIIRKQRAKENLKRLEDELSKINQAKRRSKSKNTMIIKDNMIKQSKFMEKKSENMLNNLLNERKSARYKIFNQKEILDLLEVVRKDEKELDLLNEDDIDEFYKEDGNVLNEKCENILNLNNDHLNNFYPKVKIPKEYEEPILREIQPKEEISRLNPVDLESFVKINYNSQANPTGMNSNSNINFYPNTNIDNNYNSSNHNKNILHHKNSDNYLTANRNKFDNYENLTEKIKENPKQNNSDYFSKVNMNSYFSDLNVLNIEDILKSKENSDKNIKDFYNTNQIDPLKKHMASSIVSEFLKDLNHANLSIECEEKKRKQEISNFVYEDPKFVKYGIEKVAKTKTELNINKDNPIAQNNLARNPNSLINLNESKTNFNYNAKTQINNKNEIIHEQDQEFPESHKNVNEFQRDETKWKYSKDELLERRKKMLKDKSHIKK